MINVLIISSYRLICASLAQVINNESGMEVVAVAEDYQSALDCLNKNSVDVVIYEVMPPSIDHFESIRELRTFSPSTRCLVLSTQSNDIAPNQYFNAGAGGYVTRKSSVEEVLFAIREVNEGKRYLCRDCAQQMALGNIQQKDNPFAVLSNREMEVMMMITAGCKVVSISDKLHLSPKTVNTYRYRLFSKLGVDNDVSLTRLAIRQGFMEA